MSFLPLKHIKESTVSIAIDFYVSWVEKGIWSPGRTLPPGPSPSRHPSVPLLLALRISGFLSPFPWCHRWSSMRRFEQRWFMLGLPSALRGKGQGRQQNGAQAVQCGRGRGQHRSCHVKGELPAALKTPFFVPLVTELTGVHSPGSDTRSDTAYTRWSFPAKETSFAAK